MRPCLTQPPKGTSWLWVDSHVSLLCQGKTLDYRVLAEGQAPIPVDDEKSLSRSVEQARARQRKHPRYKPSPDHPRNRWAPLNGARHPLPPAAT